tara:strand:- start:4032 stop:4289 length:258 start_codon:yes stop_codon:yes gene_type:complete
MKKRKYNKQAKGDVVIKNVRMHESYGPFKYGNEYKVLGQGNDWVKIRNRGSVYHVPLAFVEVNPVSYKKQEDIDVEYEMYEDYNF